MALLVSSVPLSQAGVFGQRLILAELIQEACQTSAGDRGVHNLSHLLPGIVIHQAENAEPLAVGQLIRHEVHRPWLVRPCGNRHRHPRARDPLAGLGTHLQAFLVINLIRCSAFLGDSA